MWNCVTCPATEPTGQCTGMGGAQCSYGSNTCFCIGGNWNCSGGAPRDAGAGGGMCPATEPTAGNTCTGNAVCPYNGNTCACVQGHWLCG
jgi:hypothetical protein